MIAPQGSSFQGLSISFTQLHTQAGVDVIRVFQCSNLVCSQQQQLAQLSGFYSQPQAVTASTGFVKVSFTSDGTVNYDGFKAVWSTVCSAIFWGHFMAETPCCVSDILLCMQHTMMLHDFICSQYYYNTITHKASERKRLCETELPVHVYCH
jgi:hypothetical protein